MPNNVRNSVIIVGKDQEKVAELVGLKLDEPKFDFNAIIPIPTEIETTKADPTITQTGEEADKINSEFVPNEWNNMPIQAISQDEKDRRLKEYGAIDWYSAHNAYWGTKWGAYDIRNVVICDEYVFVQLDTAWSHSDAIFNGIEKQYEVEVHAYIDGEIDSPDYYGYPYSYLNIETIIEPA